MKKSDFVKYLVGICDKKNSMKKSDNLFCL